MVISVSNAIVNARYWHNAKENFREEFEKKGRDYIEGYLNAINDMPIRRFIDSLLMNKRHAKYRGAKEALENLLLSKEKRIPMPLGGF